MFKGNRDYTECIRRVYAWVRTGAGTNQWERGRASIQALEIVNSDTLGEEETRGKANCGITIISFGRHLWRSSNQTLC